MKTLARRAKYDDMFTAELAAWCAEIHEHLRELETDVGVQLILMGVPRQLYDLDLLLAAMRDERQWEAIVAYCRLRYERECAQWNIPLAHDQPIVGLRERLVRWADCTDSDGERWKIIRAVQQSQLRREVHHTPWGWRARSLRLGVAIECSTLENGWAIWQQALATAAIVPPIKAKRYKGALAELAGVNANSLPLELHDFAWDVLGRGAAPLPERVSRAYEALTSIRSGS